MADSYLCWNYADDAHPTDPRPNDLPVNSGQTQDPPPPPQSSFTTNEPVTAAPPTVNDDPSLSQAPGPPVGDTPDPATSTEIEILIIDIYTLSTSVKVSCVGDQTMASTLAGLGFIGNAPFHPSVAVSIKTLKLYRILCRRKPSFSIEAFVKVISDLYMVRASFNIHSPSFSLYKRFHIVPSTVDSFRARLMHTWRSSALLISVSRQRLAMTVLTGVS